jgi:predicted transcriptional regulator
MSIDPTTIRNQTWDSIQERLTGDRFQVWQALCASTPVTTRELAGIMGRRCEDVRPRVTELCQMGLAVCIGRTNKEGRYQGIDIETARLNFDCKRAVLEDQPLLKL